MSCRVGGIAVLDHLVRHRVQDVTRVVDQQATDREGLRTTGDERLIRGDFHRLLHGCYFCHFDHPYGNCDSGYANLSIDMTVDAQPDVHTAVTEIESLLPAPSNPRQNMVHGH